MTYLIIAASSLLAAVLALALLREIQLRKALEALLRKILKLWRTPNETNRPKDPSRSDSADDARRV